MITSEELQALFAARAEKGPGPLLVSDYCRVCPAVFLLAIQRGPWSPGVEMLALRIAAVLREGGA